MTLLRISALTVVLLAVALALRTGGSVWRQVVKLRIAERYKGVAEADSIITASIANEHEAVFLTAGKHYIIYANLHGNGFWDTGCSRTRPVDGATEELTQLGECARR